MPKIFKQFRRFFLQFIFLILACFTEITLKIHKNTLKMQIFEAFFDDQITQNLNF
jgi:hypothetical protein